MKVFDTEFVHSKFDGLDGRTVSQWKEKDVETGGLKFRVTTQGLKISGELSTDISTEEHFEEFAMLMGRVLEEVRRMRPKLYKTLSGHE